MNRRGFLGAILAAGVAPAVVGSGILMPVRARPEYKFFTYPNQSIWTSDPLSAERWGAVGDHMARELARSMQETREILSARILNEASLEQAVMDLARYGGAITLHPTRISWPDIFKA